jgi:predicted nicotinamide N-methyase
MDKYFIREFQLMNNVTLEFLQHTVGDVGCVVWDAALVLAGYLDNSVKHLDNLNILELGSGTGCVGLVAAALGYSYITCTLFF